MSSHSIYRLHSVSWARGGCQQVTNVDRTERRINHAEHLPYERQRDASLRRISWVKNNSRSIQAGSGNNTYNTRVIWLSAWSDRACSFENHDCARGSFLIIGCKLKTL